MKTLDEVKRNLPPEALEIAESTKKEVILGNELQRFRKEVAQITQRELADRLNVSQAEISKLENRRDMLIHTLVKYCQAIRADFHISAHSGVVTIQLLTPEEVKLPAVDIHSEVA